MDDIRNFRSNQESNLHETTYLKLDCTKAKTKLGWEPKMNLDLALEYTVEWYEKFIQKENIREFSEHQIKNFPRL